MIMENQPRPTNPRPRNHINHGSPPTQNAREYENANRNIHRPIHHQTLAAPPQKQNRRGNPRRPSRIQKRKPQPYCTRLGVGSAGIPPASISRARAATAGTTDATRSSSKSAATPG